MQTAQTPSSPSAAVMSHDAPSGPNSPRLLGARAQVAIASAVAGCLLVLAVFVAVLHATSGTSAKQPSVPSEWQTYRDPAGLFSLRLPAGWTAHVTEGTASIADLGGRATEKTELIVFSDPAHRQTGARVSIYAEPIQTEFERRWYCRGRSQAQSTFHGLPAEHYVSTWIFSTTAAHFQVMYTVPGSAGATASPASASAKATPIGEQSTVDQIVSSFQAANGSPLAC